MRRTSEFLRKMEEKTIGGLVKIFRPANSGFRNRPVLILHSLKLKNPAKLS